VSDIVLRAGGLTSSWYKGFALKDQFRWNKLKM
jgi:hypothetical protein